MPFARTAGTRILVPFWGAGCRGERAVVAEAVVNRLRTGAFGLLLAVLLLGGGCAGPSRAPAPSATTAPAAGAAAQPAAVAAAPSVAPTAAAAPSASASSAAPLNPPVTVKVASLLGLTDAGLFIGMDRGYFAEEGLDVDSSRVDGAAQAMPHVATGQLDLAGVTPSSASFTAV
jgi:ABC-type nitrate/sulfonate/bicarbonate transport system substrate-binding protein